MLHTEHFKTVHVQMIAGVMQWHNILRAAFHSGLRWRKYIKLKFISANELDKEGAVIVNDLFF